MPIFPNLEFEQALWLEGKTRLVGLDEVGRGAYTASVVAAAVILPNDEKALSRLAGVRDSKMLSREARVRLVSSIRQTAVAYGIGAASPAEIERFNIRGATALAMKRALRRIGTYDHLLVDGLRVKELGLEQQTAIVKGDALCLSIACASVIAKVCRDGLMYKLAARYPGYGWENNVGYGTPEHIAGLNRLGITPHHRRSFAPIRALLQCADGA
ncbi:MAG: ribonuclease HII [Chloroflexi bacterium]|uniref:Ribonuclease HII n=1 Tax=Candidatus Chlorohelix allophototropha TaxID=3003348 RepID=A0A8T7LXP1_9CHLR|nr:ribonuclease HII [Chloroflexota bacterium]WJW66873.1 ribonuclease HII [Chloroflexota bacterium L227-S17]